MIHSKYLILIVLLLGRFTFFPANAENKNTKSRNPVLLPAYIGETQKKASAEDEKLPVNAYNIRLKYKTVPLSDPVYRVIDYYETQGILGFLPLAKPYRKITVIQQLEQILLWENLSPGERKVVLHYLSDFLHDSNSVEILKQSSGNSFLLFGTGAESSFRKGFGDHASWSTSHLIQPFIAGDLGENITFMANVNAGFEQLSPDLFYQSYTTKGQVHFPNENFGYSYLPYQFQLKTNYTHYNRGWSPPFDNKLQLALYNVAEFNALWLEGALELSFNNQQRSWGHKEKNLLLSGTARRFPGLEMKIQPVSWFRYSYVVGSLFWLPMEHGAYRESVYGEDLGRSRKMFTSHMMELIPFPWLQLTGANSVIWPQRMELSYMAPLVPPSLVQDNLGDQDNPSLYFDIATQFKGFGKAWLGIYLDDFNLTDSWQLLKYPMNKYAWQMGWRTNLLSALIPGTTSALGYTRVTPFVYTHYPESDFSAGNARPIDITFTHDGFNLGFYLPPNSGELSWSLVNIAIPDLVLSMENRLIMHGTNDLASENIYQIYGDIYHHHGGEKYSYPLLDFTNDGIYDFSFQSELKFDWKIRTSGVLRFYRLNGGFGYSKTWWKSNASQVVAPASTRLLTGSLGIVIDV